MKTFIKSSRKNVSKKNYLPSQAMKPNLGKEKEANYDELLTYFKGSEAQGFFEKLRDGKIKVSYKPQHVDLIPKTSKGTVKDLLEKANEDEKIAKYLQNEIIKVIYVPEKLLNIVVRG